MTIVWTVILGLVIGLVARAVMPGKDAAGLVATTVLGIAGALVGTVVGRALGITEDGLVAGFILSVLGAVGLLVAYRYLAPKASAPPV